MTYALIVVDVQKDFCEGGSLAVPGGNDVAEKIANNLIRKPIYDIIVTTRDWHDADNDNQGHFSDSPDFKDTWPPHCVGGTEGAELHPAIELATLEGLVDSEFAKGQGKPAYSGFEGKNSAQWTLSEYLKWEGVTHIDVVGIAGDYCVRATALDAVKLGYNTVVLPSYVVSVGGDEATARVAREVNVHALY